LFILKYFQKKISIKNLLVEMLCTPIIFLILPLVVDRANASSTGGGLFQNRRNASLPLVLDTNGAIDKGGGQMRVIDSGNDKGGGRGIFEEAIPSTKPGLLLGTWLLLGPGLMLTPGRTRLGKFKGITAGGGGDIPQKKEKTIHQKLFC
jgi:hypothetical protein